MTSERTPGLYLPTCLILYVASYNNFTTIEFKVKLQSNSHPKEDSDIAIPSYLYTAILETL